MEESSKSRILRPRFYLQPPPDGFPRRSHTEPARFKNEVRFLLPGTKQKKQTQLDMPQAASRGLGLGKAHFRLPEVVAKFDSADTAQPFLNPDILDEWQRATKDGKTKS